MLTGVKFRAYPTKEQANTLSQWIGCARLVYNQKVAQERDERKKGAPAIDQSYALIKTKERPFLKELPSQVLRNSATRWYGAYQRHLKGLGGRPTFKKRGDHDSVWLTNDLFIFHDGLLLIGTDKYPFGELRFHAHRPFETPKSLVIRREGGRWYVSFCYEIQDETVIRTEEELLHEASLLSENQLRARSIGYDRGVAIPVQTSNGTSFRLTPVVEKRLQKKEKSIRRFQRSLARKREMRPDTTKSKRYEKTQSKIKRAYEYGSNARQDFAHQTSHSLVASEATIFVEEALKIQAMTKRPKAKQDERGKWLPNGRRAKAGLHRAILRSCWGRVSLYLRYKAARCNKLVVSVPPHYSSQECSECHFVHPDNRQNQNLFLCQQCGFTSNADTNASCNIKERGLRQLLEQKVEGKKKKKVSYFKKASKEKLGQERPEVTQGEMS